MNMATDINQCSMLSNQEEIKQLTNKQDNRIEQNRTNRIIEYLHSIHLMTMILKHMANLSKMIKKRQYNDDNDLLLYSILSQTKSNILAEIFKRN